MDDDNLLIICRACGRKVLMHNMRPDGENMICLECYKRKSGVQSAQSIFAKKEVENTPYHTKEEKKTVKSEKMVRYICTNCKYKFSRKESQHVGKCPYCGKDKIVVDTQLGAEKLLNESQNKKYDW